MIGKARSESGREDNHRAGYQAAPKAYGKLAERKSNSRAPTVKKVRGGEEHAIINVGWTREA